VRKVVGNTLVITLLAGCVTIPPERVERDRVILAAAQPCKERYLERLYNAEMMSVTKDGTVRFWYKGNQVSAAEDIRRCLSEATKGLKLGPWLPGRLTKAGPASVPISTAGKDITVAVRVNGILGTMVVRASADFTFLTFAYAQRAGLQIAGESPTIWIRSGGQSIAAPYVRARAVEVGDAQVEAVNVVLYQQVRDLPDADGVLGKPFLSHFKMTVDRANGRMALGMP
jgi:hypothetical protein